MLMPTLPQRIAAYLAPILADLDLEKVEAQDIFRYCCEGGFEDAKRSDLEAALRILMQREGANDT